MPQLDSQGCIGKGVYGRFIIRVLFKEHDSASWANFGENLLLRGMAFVFPIFGIPRRYAAATKTAQDKQCGLFGHLKEVLRAVLPWECRKRNHAKQGGKSEEDEEGGKNKTSEGRAMRKEGKTVNTILDAQNQHGTMYQISCPHGLPNELLDSKGNCGWE